MENYVVYIIYSGCLDRYYVGHTGDIEKRIAEHNSGMSTYTAKSDDWGLVYTATFPTRKEAHDKELEIKKKKSRKYIEWLINNS